MRTGRRRNVLAPVSALVLLAACASGPPRLPPPSAGTVPPAPAGEWRVYPGPHGDYRLTVPAEWPEGSYAFQKASDLDLPLRYAGARSAVRIIYLPAGGPGTTEPHQVASLRVYAPEVWAEVSPSQGPPMGRVIAASDRAVFVASTLPGNPYLPDSLDGTRYGRMRDGLDRLWKSLETLR